jgi:hypothetical protein
MKDIVDALLLVLKRHAVIAEMGLLAAPGHRQ